MDFHRALVLINPVAGQHDSAETCTLIAQRFARVQVAYEIRATQAASAALGVAGGWQRL